jgi:hypothetical protein
MPDGTILFKREDEAEWRRRKEMYRSAAADGAADGTVRLPAELARPFAAQRDAPFQRFMQRATGA